MGEHQERTLRIPLGGNGSEHRKIYCAIRLPDLYESNIYNPLAKTGGQIKYSSVKGVRPVSSGRLFFFCPFLKTDKLSQRTEIKLSFLGDAGRRLIQNVREGVRRVPWKVRCCSKNFRYRNEVPTLRKIVFNCLPGNARIMLDRHNFITYSYHRFSFHCR